VVVRADRSGAVLIVGSTEHRAHAPTAPQAEEGGAEPSPEVPARVDVIEVALADAGLGAPVPPTAAAWASLDDDLRLVHDPAYLACLATVHADWVARGGGAVDRDLQASVRPVAGAPRPADLDRLHPTARLGLFAHDDDALTAGTWAAARASAACATTAVRAVLDGAERTAYALCRPPGHHAGPASLGGYCFLSNAAVAAAIGAAAGARVGVVDVDVHHGNGTQAAFWARGDVLVASVHSDPAVEYPYHTGFADEVGVGAGEGANCNVPLPRGTDWSAYEPALAHALAAVRRFGPELVVVSLGVDTAVGDRWGFRLGRDDFTRIGGALGGLGVPLVLVQEGGYDLPTLGGDVAAVLAGALGA
jgi:acetoin utilization deacetylase AcuC-like enzyme